jgi:regulator of protease activity HflC (stomatin/prohibitin superfamily)
MPPKATPQEEVMSAVEPMLERSTVLVIALVALVALGFSTISIFQNNDVGHYQVKQAAFTGNMTVRNDPGIYLQMFGKITDYPLTGLIEFSADGQGDGDPFKATFRGNSTADISGIMKYQLSQNAKDQLLLNERYGSAHTVQDTLVRQALAEAIKQTGPLFSPEEAFVLKRSEFTKIALDMLKKGIFKTYTEDVEFKMEDGTKRIETVTKIVTDKSGLPIVEKPSTLLDYNITVIDFTIRDFNFDEKTTELINTKKQTEQEKVVSRSNAERAKQDAITALEQGKAKVASAEAEQNVIKVKSVVEAQKNYEVAKFQRLQAEQEAQAKIVQGRAESEVSRLKVAAGLSPLERANIEKDTRIGVAAEIAKVKFPDSMVIVGGGNGPGAGKVDPFSAVGLESFYNLSERMAKQNPNKQ